MAHWKSGKLEWVRIDCDIDEHPDVVAAGFWGGTVFKALICVSGQFGLWGRVPAKYQRAAWLAHRLGFGCDPACVEAGIEAAVCEGLVVRDGEDLVIPGWQKYVNPESWRKAEQRAGQSGQKPDNTVTVPVLSRDNHGTVPVLSGTSPLPYRTVPDRTVPEQIPIPQPPPQGSGASPAPAPLLAPEEKPKPHRHQWAADDWNTIVAGPWGKRRCDKVASHEKAIDAATAKNPDRDYWRQVMAKIAASDKLRDGIDSWPGATFGWVWATNRSRTPNHANVMEGAFDDRKVAATATSTPADETRAWHGVLSALRDYTGAPGDERRLLTSLPPRSAAAVTACGGGAALAEGVEGNDYARGRVERSFREAWRVAT